MALNSKGYRILKAKDISKPKLMVSNARPSLALRKAQNNGKAVYYTTKQRFIGQSEYNLHGHKHNG